MSDEPMELVEASIVENQPIDNKKTWEEAARGNIFALHAIAKKVNLPFVSPDFDRDTFKIRVTEFYDHVVKNSHMMNNIVIFFEIYLKETGFIPAKEKTDIPFKKHEILGDDEVSDAIWTVAYLLMLAGINGPWSAIHGHKR